MLNFHSKHSKKDDHARSKSEVSVDCRATAKGKKTFLAKRYVSVAVSKLVNTDLVFVQPGAKINSVYYCENVLKKVETCESEISVRIESRIESADSRLQL